MFLFVASALAAPPVPMLADRGATVALAADAATATDLLVDPECTGDACEAHRHREWLGGLVQAQVTPWIGAWAEVDSETTSTAAALFTATGYAITAGVYGAPWPNRAVGALTWVNADFGDSSTATGDAENRWQLDVGGAVRVGRPSDGVMAWLGGNLLALGNDTESTGGGRVDIPLAPLAPLEAVGGATLMSEPLAGLASSARVIFSVQGSLGARNSFGANLGFTL